MLAWKKVQENLQLVPKLMPEAVEAKMRMAGSAAVEMSVRMVAVAGVRLELLLVVEMKRLTEVAEGTRRQQAEAEEPSSIVP